MQARVTQAHSYVISNPNQLHGPDLTAEEMAANTWTFDEICLCINKLVLKISAFLGVLWVVLF